MSTEGNDHSIPKELLRNWKAIVFYWDFLLALAVGTTGIWLQPWLSDRAIDVVGQVAEAIAGQAPAIGITALTLAIASLTFLSAVSPSAVFKNAAKAGALRDFATFSWWEGTVALFSLGAWALMSALTNGGNHLVAGLSLYVVLGLFGLLTRLVHIVYRYSDHLASME